ncbi:MAG TPA: response regulator [Candidatus Eremiobacteraeota bacterium]|nr:MAG: Alkaline phosphatase synthesis transcriptional regulatory protein PhoP [bacterium ADurb.Bin363]HPZ07506.1 response regulator [Candidatus Eremiobacteraeota bacterium]
MMNKILIIDDDLDLVDAMTNLLEAKGYEINNAPDGEEGCEKAKTDTPDLILLDVMMTRKTEGFDVARSLKKDEKTKDIPIILITGIRHEMNLPFGFEPDADFLPVKAVLEKPIKPELLLNTVAEHIKK